MKKNLLLLILVLALVSCNKKQDVGRGVVTEVEA